MSIGKIGGHDLLDDAVAYVASSYAWNASTTNTLFHDTLTQTANLMQSAEEKSFIHLSYIHSRRRVLITEI